MADDTDDPDIAAARLEAALEQIERLTARSSQPAPASGAQPADADPATAAAALPDPSAHDTISTPGLDESAMSAQEIAERLDILIDRLRAALGSKAE